MDTDRHADEQVLVGKARRFSFYLIQMSPTEEWTDEGETWEAAIHEHRLWLQSLERQGVLFLAGPIDRHEWDGTGMVVIRGTSREEAETVAMGEPFHRRGMRRNVVRHWYVNEGQIRIVARLFEDTVELQ